MKSWNTLFIRQGIHVREMGKQLFDCRSEREENVAFLLESLERAEVKFFYDGEQLAIESTPVSEEQWLETVDFPDRGRSGEFWFKPGKEVPKARELDTYISGVVREFNRLGLYTVMCCDGHGRGTPFVEFQKAAYAETAKELLLALGVRRAHVRNRLVTLHVKREELLDVVEELHKVQREWLEEGMERLKRQLFYQSLEQLLSISGASGNEGHIRDFVVQLLKPFVDRIAIDRNGNVVAQKTYGRGNGPTILFNAHLDTVDEFVPGRVIEKDGKIWSSSAGILGADDRAGVAVILEVARRLQSSRFSGTVKFIFTVEEEVGLVGARSVDEYFLWDVDAAIVVDRRGAGDIITSCGGYQAFCKEQYGQFFEQVAALEGLAGWACRAGGSSDTRIWASHGIQSVNLSVGYQNEHTEYETLDVEACYGTVKLLEGVFRQTQMLRRVLQDIHREALAHR